MILGENFEELMSCMAKSRLSLAHLRQRYLRAAQVDRFDLGELPKDVDIPADQRARLEAHVF